MSTSITRKDVDDFARRNTSDDSYKNRLFNGKRTAVDEYTGKKIFYSSKGHFSTKTTANIDHVIPIDQMIKRYQGKLSAKEIKDIANSDINLAATSERLNKIKSNMSNHEYLYNQFKKGKDIDPITSYNMLEKEFKANTAITANAAVRQIGNILNLNKSITAKMGNTAGDMVSAGSSTALVTLTMSSIENLAMVASGRKNLKDATKDVAKDAAGGFVSVAGRELAKAAIKEITSAKVLGSATKFIPGVSQLAAIAMVGDSVWKFANGEMDAEECAIDILMNGAGALAVALAPMTGGASIAATIVAGAIVQTMNVVIKSISSGVKSIYSSYKEAKRMDAKRDAEFRKIIDEANIALEQQRRRLKELQFAEQAKFKTACDKGFEQIFLASLNNDADGISQGLNCILSNYNEVCAFKTLDKFNNFFDDTDSVFSF